MSKRKTVLVLSLVLSAMSFCAGCQLDTDADSDTLLSGHRQGETKRHASDWAVPLAEMPFSGDACDSRNTCPVMAPGKSIDGSDLSELH